MAAAITLVYDQNTRQRSDTGDITMAILEITLSGNYPGAGGEQLNLSTWFRQVYAMLPAGSRPGVLQYPSNYIVPDFEADVGTAGTGNLRFFQVPDIASPPIADAPLRELPNAAYPGNFMNPMRFMVWGRPITDQG